MKTEAGVWIDHRKAVVVTITDTSEEMREIPSQDSPEDQGDRRFTGPLDPYYDEVVASLRGVDSILIFGRGEAKAELEVRLEQEAVHGSVVHLESAARMTERRIAARGRRRADVGSAARVRA